MNGKGRSGFWRFAPSCLHIRINSNCINFQREYYSRTFMKYNFEQSSAVSLRLMLGLFLALVAVIPIQANQVTTAPGFGPYSAGDGEYTMTVDAGVASVLSGYSNGVTMNIPGFANSFQTFCVERNEYIAPGTTYDVTLNSTTVFTARPLTIGAAYLYQQFATGQLMDYNYGNSPLGSRVGSTASHGTAFELQQAIWYYMGEYSFNTYNFYMDGVVPVPANPFGAYTGSQVRVLNLWAPGQPHDPAHAFQDVLVLTVPEPSMFALASLGAAALLALRRRK
jgi:hypothetical protein